MQSGKKKKKSKLDFNLLQKTKKKYASGGAYSEGVSSAASSIPVWGQLAGATMDISKSIKGDETSGTANAFANSFDPASGVTGALDEGDTEGALLAAFNPIGYGFYEADKAEQELKTQKRIAMGNVNRIATAGATTSFKDGGVMLSKKLGPTKGGKLEAISDEAVEVKGNDPEATDGVETPDAFLDHDEMVTTDNKVFSDSVFLPSGKSVAKRGKEIEKMRTEHYDPRFGDKSPYYKFLDKKNDDLFEYQESVKGAKKKEGLSDGGELQPPAKGKKTFSQNEILFLQSKLSADPHMKANAAYLYTPENKLSPADSVDQAATQKWMDKPMNITAKTDSMVSDINKGKKAFFKKQGLKKGGIHIKPENKGKFTATKKKTGKSTEELTHSKNPVTRKRAIFAQNAKKWHHVDGGKLKPKYEGGTEDLWQFYNRQKPVTTEERGFQEFLNEPGWSSDQGTQKKGVDWNQVGTIAATYAPNITNAILQNKLKGPAAPVLESSSTLRKFSADPQLTETARQTRQAQKVISSNTAQASDLTSATGSLLARRLSSENAIKGDLNRLNTEIGNRQAEIDMGVRARNAAKTTAFRQSQADFENKKLQMTSQNVANLSEKTLMRGREKNEMQLDRDKYAALMTTYNDLPEEMKAKYAHLFENDKLKQKFGGKLYKKRKKAY